MEKYVLFVVIGPIRHPELIPNVRSNGRKRRIVIKSLHNGRRRRRPRRSRYPQDDRGKKGVPSVVLRSTCGKKSAPVVTHLLRCSKEYWPVQSRRFWHIETGLSRCSAETTDLSQKPPSDPGPSHPRASSPGRTRTYDKAVNSRLLYQLSYRGLKN